MAEATPRRATGCYTPQGRRAALTTTPRDAPGKSAYPIVYASWAITDRKPSDPVRTPWIRAYLAFLLGDGQALLEQGPYGRLPAAVVKRALAAIGKP